MSLDSGDELLRSLEVEMAEDIVATVPRLLAGIAAALPEGTDTPEGLSAAVAADPDLVRRIVADDPQLREWAQRLAAHSRQGELERQDRRRG